MFAKLIASASVYLVATTLYTPEVKADPTPVAEPVVPEVKESVPVEEVTNIEEPGNSIPQYRFISAVNKNTDDLNLIRAFYQPGFIVPNPKPKPPNKVNPVQEATPEKLGKRVEPNQRSAGSLYHERKRTKKKAKRKATDRTHLPPRYFIPPTVEPTVVNVELFADLEPGPEHARHQTPLRFHRSRSARRT